MAHEWTPTRISALIGFWTEGLTASEIGKRLEITKNAVVGKVHRLGLPKRTSPIQRKASTIAKVIQMSNLKTGMCCWPDGEPGTDNFHFCGKDAIADKPYCLDHCERAYVKPSRDSRKSAA